MDREKAVYAMALVLVGASIFGAFGVLRVRASQADDVYPVAFEPIENGTPAAPNDSTAAPAQTATPSGSPPSPPAPTSVTAPAVPTKPITTTSANATAAKAPPAPDADRDGIPDARDRCPTRPETRNGYLDTDGCPDVITTTRAS